LLASDLDGTLIPPDEAPARMRELDDFRATVDALSLSLAYVTGRHLESALRGIERFRLPRPDALSCDVGTTVYWRRGDEYFADAEYHDVVAASPGVAEAEQVRDLLADVSELWLQEPENQGAFKVSYYAARPLTAAFLREIGDRVADAGRMRLVSSHAPTSGRGLLDVLPEAVGKASAVRHVAQRMGFGDDEVVFAGDSGNDEDALLSGVHAVVVANAPDSVRADVRAAAEARGLSDRVFFASGRYAAGVTEGLRRLAPTP
jgi:HAD superfamily hydrolase (TIGR01484 family)